MHSCSWQNAMLTEVVLHGNCHPGRILRFQLDSPEQANFNTGSEWQIGPKDMSEKFWLEFFNSNCRLTVMLWTIHYASEKIQLSNYWTHMTYCLKRPQYQRYKKQLQHHRIEAEVARILWKLCCPTHAAQAGSPTAHCPRLFPDGFWIFPRMVRPQAPRAIYGNTQSFSQQKVFPDFMFTGNMTFFVFTCAHCLLFCHWGPKKWAWLCLLYTLPSDICRRW